MTPPPGLQMKRSTLDQEVKGQCHTMPKRASASCDLDLSPPDPMVDLSCPCPALRTICAMLNIGQFVFKISSSHVSERNGRKHYTSCQTGVVEAQKSMRIFFIWKSAYRPPVEIALRLRILYGLHKQASDAVLKRISTNLSWENDINVNVT